jgi:hypothetical protein
MTEYANGHPIPTDSPTPERPHYVARDGVRVSPYFGTEGEAWTWTLKNQGMSVDWATRYEGYALRSNEEVQQ